MLSQTGLNVKSECHRHDMLSAVISRMEPTSRRYISSTCARIQQLDVSDILSIGQLTFTVPRSLLNFGKLVGEGSVHVGLHNNNGCPKYLYCTYSISSEIPTIKTAASMYSTKYNLFDALKLGC